MIYSTNNIGRLVAFALRYLEQLGLSSINISLLESDTIEIRLSTEDFFCISNADDRHFEILKDSFEAWIVGLIVDKRIAELAKTTK